jgi:hypothetical protein
MSLFTMGFLEKLKKQANNICMIDYIMHTTGKNYPEAVLSVAKYLGMTPEYCDTKQCQSQPDTNNCQNQGCPEEFSKALYFSYLESQDEHIFKLLVLSKQLDDFLECSQDEDRRHELEDKIFCLCDAIFKEIGLRMLGIYSDQIS